MSTGQWIAVAVAVVVVLAVLGVLTLARKSDVRGAGELSAETRRRDSSTRTSNKTDAAAAVEREATARRSTALATVDTGVASSAGSDLAPFVPPDRAAIDTSRREFFNRAIVSLMGLTAGQFAAASFVAYLWPTKSGGFGGKVSIGRIDDVKAGITTGSGFFYAPEARAWITSYPGEALAKAAEVYQAPLLPAIESGLIASYQKCPHLGCRVPQCVSSQWFECGCHGSQYNRVGEKKGGPAPRGLDHFPLEITSAGEVIVDTGTIIDGQPIGVNTTGQEAEGPHCVGATEH